MSFHLAIPATDLAKSKDFYISLGATCGREYASHVVLKFFDAQLVLHKCDRAELLPVTMYPRHFGVILENRVELDKLWFNILNLKKGAAFQVGPWLIYQPIYERQVGNFAAHSTFFLQDPADNLVEFKCYDNPSAIFSADPLEQESSY